MVVESLFLDLVRVIKALPCHCQARASMVALLSRMGCVSRQVFPMFPKMLVFSHPREGEVIWLLKSVWNCAEETNVRNLVGYSGNNVRLKYGEEKR